MLRSLTSRLTTSLTSGRLGALLGAVALTSALAAPTTAQQFEKARPKDPKFFPVAVWLQSPHNAQRYRDIGVNLYVGLFNGPTEAQLQALDKAKMPVICHQNEVGLAHQGDTIVAWMHGDEPDNAQGRRLRGYKPPIPPHEIVAGFEAMRKIDKRPVLLNLGQGAAWDSWHGRGERTNHPEDYPEYVKGCDIVSFDIYPVTHTHRDVKGKLEFVGNGVRRLRKWTKFEKPVWACIETGHIHNAAIRPTPAQVRTEVWQAIACGADGIIYFAHEFAPKFVEAGVLAHDDVRTEVEKINRDVLESAAVLNSPQLRDLVTIKVGDAEHVAVRAHRYKGSIYLFVASLQNQPSAVHLKIRGKRSGKVHALDGGKNPPLREGLLKLELDSYGVARYRIGR